MKFITPTLALASALALGSTSLPAASPSGKAVARGIHAAPFASWTEALTLQSKDAAPRATIVPAFGGRVLAYGLRGDNLLWIPPEPPTADSASLSALPLPGGFHCHLGPETARPDNQGHLANGPYDWSVKGRSPVLILRSPDDKPARASLEREIMFDPATGEIGFLHRLKNLSDQDATFTLAPNIACRPGGFVLLPLSKKSRFPASWARLQDDAGKPAWNGTNPALDSVRLLDGILVARTGSGSARIGTDSDSQWMAYVLGRSLFILHFPFYASAVYAEGGNSVTCSWNDQRTELQPVGPEARIRSRRTSELPMKWSLLELPSEVTSFEQARAAANQVPVSPFL